MRIASTLFLCVLLLTPACATFRAGNVTPAPEWPLQASPKKWVRLTVGFESTFNGNSGTTTDKDLGSIVDATQNEYRTSGLFAAINADPDSAELSIDVSVTRISIAPISSAVITGLTLLLVPAKGSDTFVVKTVIKDKQGAVIWSSEKTETVTLYIELFLFVLAPFKPYWPTYWSALLDIHRSTIAEAHEQGIL